MRGRALRGALTAALLCGTLTLLACPLGRLRVLIPDYETAGVRGLRIYRVDDATGQLTGAGHVAFLALEQSRDGERMKYMQYDANGVAYFGPLYTIIARDPNQPAAIQLTVAMLNQLPAGWFKVASYNAYGTSPVSSGQTFVVGEG
jgi:hypothetical protein